MAVALSALRPAHVPRAWRLRRTLGAEAQIGFGEADVVSVFYTRGQSPEDFRLPLVVHVGRPGAPPLTGTEGRDGDPLSLDGADAVYHDGMWMPGPGEAQQLVGDLPLHWDTVRVHSVTVRSPEAVVAVRAPKDAIGRAELERVARSVPRRLS